MQKMCGAQKESGHCGKTRNRNSAIARKKERKKEQKSKRKRDRKKE
jgi:hypothetical protein